jgi:hypothetical protein
MEPGTETFAWANMLPDVPKLNATRKTAAKKAIRPSKARKQAVREMDFFFIDEVCRVLRGDNFGLDD